MLFGNIADCNIALRMSATATKSQASEPEKRNRHDALSAIAVQHTHGRGLRQGMYGLGTQ